MDADTLEKIDIRWFLLCRRLVVLREKAVLAFVWRLPGWLVYWCSIRLMAHATTGKYGNTVVPELTAMDALKRWGDAA